MKQFANNMHEQRSCSCKRLLNARTYWYHVNGAYPGGTPQTTSKAFARWGTVFDVKLNNEAFIYFVEFILPKIAGAKGWWVEMCSNPLSDTKITPRHLLYFADNICGISGMQMTMLLWLSHHNQGKYTSSGINRKYGGWLEQGL